MRNPAQDGQLIEERVNTMGKAIGIDLGTTNSCAAVIENNQPKIFMYKGGNYTIPSLFAIDESGRTLVGHDAKKQAAINPQATVMGAKRLLGRNFHSKAVEKIRQVFTYDMIEDDTGNVQIKVKDEVFTLEQISSEILRKIKQVAEEYLKGEVTHAVITVPAYFNDRQRQAVRKAGSLAGLKVLRILNEPTAAALAYGLGRNLRQSLAVYDLGGGTFDISDIDIHDRVFEVIATGGDTFLGGVDFDDRVMGHIMEDFQEQHGIDLSLDRVAIQRIRDVAERAKINLSSTSSTKVQIPFIARGPKGILNVDMDLERETLEGMAEDLVGRTIDACDQIMKEAKRTPDQIDEVLLVGGQSRMPLVQAKVVDYFKRQPCKGVHPDEAVAVGAAIMAHSLTHASAKKVTLLDVLPIAIGIAKVDGSFLKLFTKNSEIPAYKSLTLTNSKDNQRSIMLKIYQGENERAVDNELLGTFVFTPIRQDKKGQVKLEVIFHIDSEGILNISAKDKQTGEKVQAHVKLKDGKKAARIEVGSGKKAKRTEEPKKAAAPTPPAPEPPAPEPPAPEPPASVAESTPTERVERPEPTPPPEPPVDDTPPEPPPEPPPEEPQTLATSQIEPLEDTTATEPDMEPATADGPATEKQAAEPSPAGEAGGEDAKATESGPPAPPKRGIFGRFIDWLLGR